LPGTPQQRNRETIPGKTLATLAGEVKNRSESAPAALAGRPLLLWGECGPEEWELIQSVLNPVGLSLQPIVQETETAGRTA